MDDLKQARAIKARIKTTTSIPQSSDRKSTDQHHFDKGRENDLIKSLRNEQQKSWKEITNILNQWRLSRGEAANLTETIVYSRFVRVSPRTATAVNEMGFHPRDYMHLHNPTQYTQAEGTGTISKAGKKRIKNYDDATELKDNMRKKMKLEDHKDLETAERSEQLMDAVARVERNFWLLVADEMERTTTKMYQPDKLAARYHAI